MKTSKLAFVAGWVISAIPIVFMGVGGVATYLFHPEQIRQGTDHLGYPARLVPVIVGLEVGCVVLYALPPTAVLGAILMTGYLGGAVASHVRVQEPQFAAAVVIGVLVWLGLFLRDPRVRALIPLRR